MTLFQLAGIILTRRSIGFNFCRNIDIKMSQAELSQTSLKRPAEDQNTNVAKKAKRDSLLPLPAIYQPVKPVKARKVAMLLGYCGAGYYGMQKNQSMPTIEGELLEAMLKAKLIDQKHYEIPQEMSFQRASRTDKGVSAFRQIVSMKIPLVQGIPQIIRDLNEHLPQQIHVFGLKQATKGFDSKRNCDHRSYCYMSPSFAFASPEVLEPTPDFRISDNELENVNKFLSEYRGTHNFHNFTAGRRWDEESCRRHMLSVTCSRPFVLDGMEFVNLKFKGQSFMLHQIRKMVGLAIANARGFAKPQTLIMSWAPPKVDIPKAPGLGLMLDHVHYERYNRKFGGDGMHEPMTWDEHEGEINEFAQSNIIPTIVEAEKETKSMLEWMSLLPLHSYDTSRTTFQPKQNIENDSD